MDTNIQSIEDALTYIIDLCSNSRIVSVAFRKEGRNHIKKCSSLWECHGCLSIQTVNIDHSGINLTDTEVFQVLSCNPR